MIKKTTTTTEQNLESLLFESLRGIKGPLDDSGKFWSNHKTPRSAWGCILRGERLTSHQIIGCVFPMLRFFNFTIANGMQPGGEGCHIFVIEG